MIFLNITLKSFFIHICMIMLYIQKDTSICLKVGFVAIMALSR